MQAMSLGVSISGNKLYDHRIIMIKGLKELEIHVKAHQIIYVTSIGLKVFLEY